MKRVVLLLLFFLIGYSTYYDLTIGTLPTIATTTMAEAPTNLVQDVDDSYVEVIIKPGDTVLSIVEYLHEGPINTSINQIIYDFEQLNPNVDPHEIKIGEVYLFPTYE